MKKCLFLSMFLINLLSLNAQNRFLTSKARAANVLNTVNTQPVATTATATATVAAPVTRVIVGASTVNPRLSKQPAQPLAKVSTVSSAAPTTATPTKAVAAPFPSTKSAPSKIKYKY